jgi:hypothetical protein
LACATQASAEEFWTSGRLTCSGTSANDSSQFVYLEPYTAGCAYGAGKLEEEGQQRSCFSISFRKNSPDASISLTFPSECTQRVTASAREFACSGNIFGGMALALTINPAGRIYGAVVVSGEDDGSTEVITGRCDV